MIQGEDMENDDQSLIEKYGNQDPELGKLMKEHEEFEARIEDLNKRPYLSSEEALERKRLQKRKLSGRDRIEEIVSGYRKRDRGQ